MCAIAAACAGDDCSWSTHGHSLAGLARTIFVHTFEKGDAGRKTIVAIRNETTRKKKKIER
jgi:predicted small metal-binding protein